MANEYVYETQFNSPHQSTRAAFGHKGKPTGITIHHWGVDGQTHSGVVKYLCSNRPSNPTSAHYVVSDGRVTCIVDPDRAAFHAGSAKGNGSTIGIECRPEMSAGDWRTVVLLCAALERVYGSMKYYRHSDWRSTSCPGRWGARMGELVRDVNAAVKDAPSAPARAPMTHRVSRGDTLWGIGRRYGVSVSDLRRLNPKVNPDALKVGSVLTIRA